jgi:hypothetical protein
MRLERICPFINVLSDMRTILEVFGQLMTVNFSKDVI